MPAAKRNANTNANKNDNANDNENAATVLAAIGNTPLVRLRAPSLAPENGASSG